jgi:type IV secretion system protein VirB8
MTNPIDKALIKNKSKVSSSSKKENVKDVDDYLQAIHEFESDRVELAKSSAKTAWKVALASCSVTLLAVLALVLLTPLKTVEPYVVRVNNSDGSVSILRPLSDAEPITYGDVLDKYWARKFIVARNGYEWETIQDNYNVVGLMSNRVVFTAYKTYIKAPNSPVATFSDKKRIKINIQDVTFLPSASKDRTLAQVRFSRDVINRAGITAVGFEPTYWNATITLDYLTDIKTADERKINPLGFRVTSYTEDRVLKK